MAITRETLYQEIWAEPSVKVAKRYGVSSSFLARVCERLRVPTPPRGYWAQVSVGKAQPKPPLPVAEPGDELEWSRDGHPARREPLPLPLPPSSNRKHVRTGSDRPKRHDLLFNARELFLEGKVFESGYLRPAKYALMDLFVSKDMLDRALSAANALYLALEDKGYPVTLGHKNVPYRRRELDERLDRKPSRVVFGHGTWNPARPTIAMFGTVAIALTLFEPSELVEARYVNGKYVRVSQAPKRPRAHDSGWTTPRDFPTGRLAVRASSPYTRVDWTKEWHEPHPGELAGMLAQIVTELEAAAPTIAKLVADAERKAQLEQQEWEQKHRRWQREEAERRQKENVEASRKQLLAIIDDWWHLRGLQLFFEDMRDRVAHLPDDERPALEARIDQARALLGSSDALQHFGTWKAPDER